MNYKIEDIDLTTKLGELSLQLPGELTFFPDNLETVTSADEFIFTESVVDLNKIFKQSNINTIHLGGDTELYRSRKNADIYLPAIFFSLSLISENPTIVSVSLNVLSNYITDFFKGSFGRKTAHVDFYMETKEKGKMKKLSYKGDAEGLKELDKIIKAFQ
jgi:hypothetical protein